MEPTHGLVLCFQQFGSVKFMIDPHYEPILWDRTYKSRRYVQICMVRPWTNVEILVLVYSEKTLVIWWTFNGRKDGSRRELLTREAWCEGHNALSPDTNAFPHRTTKEQQLRCSHSMEVNGWVCPPTKCPNCREHMWHLACQLGARNCTWGFTPNLHCTLRQCC